MNLPADPFDRGPSRPPGEDLAQVVERNIEALVNRRLREDRAKPRQERAADAITRFTGSMLFVYLHLLFFGAWIAINVGWIPLPKFDESLVILAMMASVEAIFLSTFVLISQNRMAALADKRADLDLQISLLSEHEITRLIHLVAGIADHLGLSEAQHPELHELKRDVAPEKVLDTMEEIARKSDEAAQRQS